MLSMTILLLAGYQVAHAQQTPKAYTYVERMPELPGGGGTGAIVAAFHKRLRVPVLIREEVITKAMIYFEVSATGRVQHVRLVQSSHSPALDKAVVVAIKAPPIFTPGYHNGRPVTVSFTLPASIHIQ